MNPENFKLLVAEDNPSIAQFVEQGLREEGYNVTVAKNGTDALSHVLTNHIDLAILDIMMPELNGIDLCKKIRANNYFFPIIFLTAKNSTDDTVLGFKSGANDYIKKPFSFEELLIRIETHLKYHYKIGEKLYLGNITLDIAKQKVIKNNETVLLTDKEYQLLKYLIINKDQVCSRQRIVEDVWDIHFEYDTSLLDVHMTAIRKKLNLNKDELLKTVRGNGFIAQE